MLPSVGSTRNSSTCPTLVPSLETTSVPRRTATSPLGMRSWSASTNPSSGVANGSRKYDPGSSTSSSAAKSGSGTL